MSTNLPIPSEVSMSIWRCGVGTGVQVADQVLVRMYKSRSKAVLAFAVELNDLMQMVVDESRRWDTRFSSYDDAAAFDKFVVSKAALLMARGMASDAR